MNDAEYIFHKDCKTKKEIGRNIRHRASRGGGHKVSLPSDNLTKSQWKEMNGKIESIKLNEKLKWEEFKKISKSLQKEYLQNMVEKYGARLADIADMFEISRAQMTRFVQKNFPELKFENKGLRKTDPRWNEFIEKSEEITEYEEKERPKLSSKEAVNLIREEAKELGISLPERPKIKINHGSVTMTGIPAQIFNRFSSMINKEKVYEITISFREMGD